MTTRVMGNASSYKVQIRWSHRLNAQATGEQVVKDSRVLAPASSSHSPRPTSAKGRRTRRRLLDAAQIVFERDGFLDARIADIASQAGVSHGTFYTYFDSKTEIFRTLVIEVMGMVYATRITPGDGDGLTPRQKVERGNRQWVKVVHQHRAMLRLMEEVATFDEEVFALRLRVRGESRARIRKSIERWQREGVARTDLDAGLMAGALVAMVSNFTYFWLMLGESDYDDEKAIHTLTELYASALHLPDST